MYLIYSGLDYLHQQLADTIDMRCKFMLGHLQFDVVQAAQRVEANMLWDGEDNLIMASLNIHENVKTSIFEPYEPLRQGALKHD